MRYLLAFAGLLLPLILLPGQAAASQCSYLLTAGGSETYPVEDISAFVEQEMRQRLNRSRQHFNVEFIRRCDGDEARFQLELLTENLYILGINGHTLPEDIVRYSDEPLTISRERFEASFENALWFGSLSRRQKQATLKILAFVISETARFSDVETAVNNVFTENCLYEWQEYAGLLRRWKTMSIFANSRGLAYGDQYVGGSRAFLLAPITPEIVSEYNQSVSQGWEVIRYDYDQRETDQPVQIGKAYCPANLAES